MITGSGLAVDWLLVCCKGHIIAYAVVSGFVFTDMCMSL